MLFGILMKEASLGVNSSCDEVFCCNCFWEKQFGSGVLIQLYRGGFAYQMTEYLNVNELEYELELDDM